MTRFATACFFGCVLAATAARGDVWTDYVSGGGGFEIIGSSGLIHTPWGPPVLHRTGGEGLLCAGKPFDDDALEVDAQMFGFPSRLWLELVEHVPVGYPTWWRVDQIRLCVNYMGRDVTLESGDFILNGKLKALHVPTSHRCDDLPATLGLELSTEVLSTAPHAEPGVINLYFSYGCGPDRELSLEPIRITDFQASLLVGGQPIDNWPRIVALEAPESACAQPGSGQWTEVTVRLSEPVSGRPFEYEYFVEGPGRTIRRGEIWRGSTEHTFSMYLPPDHVGDYRLIARSTEPPPGGVRSGAEAWVRQLPANDPACPLGRMLLETVRWDPRWDGCWACNVSISRWRQPRIINDRLALGATTRVRNGVVASNVLGMRAFVSDDAGGTPTSFIALGGQVLHELPGVELQAFNILGMAAGATLDPKTQQRRAVWFDGQSVKELGTLGGVSSEALALSDSGWIAGWAEDGKGARRAFISRDGGLERLTLPPHLESEANSIGDRWLAGTLVTEKGRQGFLYDLEDGEVHLAPLPEEGASITFSAANDWGRAVGTLITHNKEVIPIVFSAEDGLVRLDEIAELPAGFVPKSVEGTADDGTVYVSGALHGETAHFRFAP